MEGEQVLDWSSGAIPRKLAPSSAPTLPRAGPPVPTCARLCPPVPAKRTCSVPALRLRSPCVLPRPHSVALHLTLRVDPWVREARWGVPHRKGGWDTSVSGARVGKGGLTMPGVIKCVGGVEGLGQLHIELFLLANTAQIFLTIGVNGKSLI